MKLQAAIAVGGAVIVVAALAGSAQAVNSQTYQDSLGENPDSPDITSIVVSNDDTGLINWKINISNRPALTQDMAIPIYLDTDQNANTGDKQSGGAEYAIELDPGQVTLFKWNGSDYVVASPQTTLTYVYDSTGSYDTVWFIAIGLSVVATLLNLPIKEVPIPSLTKARAQA